MTDSLRNLAQQLDQFAQDRDWQQFHSPNNLAAALVIEAEELLEHFQWLTEELQGLGERGGRSDHELRLSEEADVRKSSLNFDKNSGAENRSNARALAADRLTSAGQSDQLASMASLCNRGGPPHAPRRTLNSLNSRAGNGVSSLQTTLIGRSPSAD